MRPLEKQSLLTFLKTGEMANLWIGKPRTEVLFSLGEPPEFWERREGDGMRHAEAYCYWGLVTWFDDEAVSCISINVEEVNKNSQALWEGYFPGINEAVDTFLDWLRASEIQTRPSPQADDSDVCYTEGGVLVVSSRRVIQTEEGWFGGERVISSFMLKKNDPIQTKKR